MKKLGVLPTFSVVIPTYNSGEWLSRAIDSVLAQHGPEVEIVVVDDASSDNTREIVERYRKRVRYHRFEENRGVSRARNKGVDIATSDWIAFLDADDFYYPDRIRSHATWIAEDPDLDFLTGDYDYQGPDGEYLGSSMASHISGRIIAKKAGAFERFVMESGDFEEFVADHFGDTHTLSVRRTTFLTLGGYPGGFQVCEDVHFLARLVAVSKRVGVCRKKLGVYVVHHGSATRKNHVSAQFENLRTLRALLGASVEFPLPVRRGVIRRFRAARLNLAYALSKSGRRMVAFVTAFPLLIDKPSVDSIRRVMSMLRGAQS